MFVGIGTVVAADIKPPQRHTESSFAWWQPKFSRCPQPSSSRQPSRQVWPLREQAQSHVKSAPCVSINSSHQPGPERQIWCDCVSCTGSMKLHTSGGGDGAAVGTVDGTVAGCPVGSGVGSAVGEGDVGVGSGMPQRQTVSSLAWWQPYSCRCPQPSSSCQPPRQVCPVRAQAQSHVKPSPCVSINSSHQPGPERQTRCDST